MTLIEQWHKLRDTYYLSHPIEEAQRFDEQTFKEQIIAEQFFIERLTFSTFAELDMLIDDLYSVNFMEMPVWMRNIMFRLACLLEPDNPQMKRYAAADLRLFGPDRDDIADRLDAEAKVLEELKT